MEPGRQFHGTYVQGWSPERLGERGVHVGTREAAVSRLRGVYGLSDHHEQVRESGAEVDFQHPVLHEVEIAGRVHPDTFHDNPQLHDYLLHAHPEYDAFRYTNNHEDMGNTSYLVRPRALRVRHQEPVSGIDHLTIEMS